MRDVARPVAFGTIGDPSRAACASPSGRSRRIRARPHIEWRAGGDATALVRCVTLAIRLSDECATMIVRRWLRIRHTTMHTTQTCIVMFMCTCRRNIQSTEYALPHRSAAAAARTAARQTTQILYFYFYFTRSQSTRSLILHPDIINEARLVSTSRRPVSPHPVRHPHPCWVHGDSTATAANQIHTSSHRNLAMAGPQRSRRPG